MINNEKIMQSTAQRRFIRGQQRDGYKIRSQYKFCTFYCKPEDLEYYFKLRQSQGSIFEYGFIVHNKDTFEDGSPKKEHIHALVYYAYQKNDTAPMLDFKHCGFKQSDGNNAVMHYCESVFNRKSCFYYLTHEDKEEKYHYSYNDIICSSNFHEYFSADAPSFDNDDIDNTCYIILQSLLDGVSPIELVRIYGKDFLYHYKCYKEIMIDCGLFRLGEK